MVRTGLLSGTQEHFLAHLLAATAVAAAVRRVDLMRWTLLALVAYAGLLELGQYFVPGRDPAIGEFASSALGATLGVGVVRVLYTALARARPQTVAGPVGPLRS
jgi:VanZ family protein